MVNDQISIFNFQWASGMHHAPRSGDCFQSSEWRKEPALEWGFQGYVI